MQYTLHMKLFPGSYIFSDIDLVFDASCFTLRVTREKLTQHLDFSLVTGEGSIGIDAIRQSAQFLRSTPSVAQYKILVITNFHLATKEAQNAFLKTFEEPPTYAYIFLVTPYIDRLLKTIVSRAITISKVKTQKSKLQLKSQKLEELLKLSLGERLLWLEQVLKKIDKKNDLKTELLNIVDVFLTSGVTKKNLQAIEYAKEIKWKIEQGFPMPKLLVEGLLTLI